MFWGLIMEPNKRYTQIVDKSFHVSMASLDFNGKVDDTVVQVMVCYENRKYVICNLMKNTVPQMALDLNFETGTKITFISNGNSSVHLTGFHVNEIEDDEDFDHDELKELDSSHKRRKFTSDDHRPGKKTKTDFNDDSVEDNDDDESYDEDFRDEEEEEEDEEEEEEEEEDEEEEEECFDDESEETEHDEASPVKQKQKNKKNRDKKESNGSSEKHKEYSKRGSETLEGGVQIKDFILGTGVPAKKGQVVSVYYVGRLRNGKKFDCVNQGKGLKFRIGRGEVIKGWDIGVAGMRVGGKRRIIVPPAVGYGPKGFPPHIPPYSTLIFEIELKNIY